MKWKVLLPALEMMNALGANHMPVIVDFSQALPKLCNEENAPLSPRLVKELTARGAFLTATGHKTGAGFGAGLIITPPGHAALKTALLAGGNQNSACAPAAIIPRRSSVLRRL
ncbi:MAG: hypothetical protein U1F27_07540 [Turneriella sp.]